MTKNNFSSHFIASWLGFLSIVVVWIVITGFELIQPEVFPGPLGVVESVAANLSFSRVIGHVVVSLFRVVIGFSFGGLAAVVLGVMSAWYLNLGNIIRAPIELLRPIPPLAWIPLAIIWLGTGIESKVLVIALGAFFPVFTSTYKGMLTIEPNIIRAGQMLGLRGARLLWKVVFPMTLPDIATGMRLGWSYSFGAMIAAEIIAAQTGLGYLVMHGRELGLVGVIIFGIILIGTLNLTTDYVIQEVILKRKLHWYYAQRGTS